MTKAKKNVCSTLQIALLRMGIGTTTTTILKYGVGQSRPPRYSPHFPPAIMLSLWLVLSASMGLAYGQINASYPHDYPGKPSGDYSPEWQTCTSPLRLFISPIISNILSSQTSKLPTHSPTSPSPSAETGPATSPLIEPTTRTTPYSSGLGRSRTAR